MTSFETHPKTKLKEKKNLYFKWTSKGSSILEFSFTFASILSSLSLLFFPLKVSFSFPPFAFEHFSYRTQPVSFQRALTDTRIEKLDKAADDKNNRWRAWEDII